MFSQTTTTPTMIVYLTAYGAAQDICQKFQSRFPGIVVTKLPSEADLVIEMSDVDYKPAFSHQLIIKLQHTDDKRAVHIGEGMMLIKWDYQTVDKIARLVKGLASCAKS
jgi:hypothetical protein